MKSSSKSLLSMYKKQCESSIVKFRDQVFGEKTLWVSRGILMSEGLSICAAMDLYKIDMLIESGICNGHSTQIWLNYDNNISIKAFDIKIKESTKKRLSLEKNLFMECGNSKVLVPEAIKNNTNKRIGVFIDGPKGVASLRLAEKCYLYDNVSFVAVHDLNAALGLQTGFRSLANKLEAVSFFTDEVWFVDTYKDLDINESNQHDTGDVWEPYKRTRNGVTYSLGGSYGWTVGFLLKNMLND